MPKRLYSSAGDGYFESFDYGESWKRPMAGLYHHYLAGLALDSGDPQNIVVSASKSAWQAHSIEGARLVVYRRTSSSSVEENDNSSQEKEDWKLVSKGLPEPNGTIISVLGQIQRFQESSMLSITVEYSALLIQVSPGRCLMSMMVFNGLKSIFHNILGLYQLEKTDDNNRLQD